MSQQRKDTSAYKHQQMQEGVQQRRVLHTSPARGATIPPMYLTRMYQLYMNCILEEELIAFTIRKSRKAIQ